MSMGMSVILKNEEESEMSGVVVLLFFVNRIGHALGCCFAA